MNEDDGFYFGRIFFKTGEEQKINIWMVGRRNCWDGCAQVVGVMIMNRAVFCGECLSFSKISHKCEL